MSWVDSQWSSVWFLHRQRPYTASPPIHNLGEFLIISDSLLTERENGYHGQSPFGAPLLAEQNATSLWWCTWQVYDMWPFLFCSPGLHLIDLMNSLYLDRVQIALAILCHSAKSHTTPVYCLHFCAFPRRNCWSNCWSTRVDLVMLTTPIAARHGLPGMSRYHGPDSLARSLIDSV